MFITIRDFKDRMDVLLTLDHEDEYTPLVSVSKNVIKTPEEIKELYPNIEVNIDKCFGYSKDELMKQTLARLKWLAKIINEKVFYANKLMDYAPSQKEDLVNILLQYQ